MRKTPTEESGWPLRVSVKQGRLGVLEIIQTPKVEAAWNPKATHFPEWGHPIQFGGTFRRSLIYGCIRFGLMIEM